MKIKTSLAVALVESMEGLKKKKLPAKLSYTINRNSHVLADIYFSFMQERQKLIELYAEKDKDGQVRADENGKVIWNDPEAFNAAIREVLQEEEEVSFRKVSEEMLGVCDDPRYDVLTPEDMEILSYMIEEE